MIGLLDEKMTKKLFDEIRIIDEKSRSIHDPSDIVEGDET